MRRNGSPPPGPGRRWSRRLRRWALLAKAMAFSAWGAIVGADAVLSAVRYRLIAALEETGPGSRRD